MKMVDINRRLTEKVTEYIAEGYIINSTTMAGHQGEIGKVDLVKGNTLIRVWLNSEHEFKWDDPNHWSDRKIVLRVGRWKYDYDSRIDRTVWMNELVTVEEYIFYELGRFGNKWYVESLAEALACLRKSNKRRLDRDYPSSNVTIITTETSKEIAANYLKSHHGYKRVSQDRIQILKKVYRDLSTPKFYIKYYGNKYELK